MPHTVLDVALLLAAAVLIYLACEWFVNGVEWCGRLMAVGEQATGTVLAAFGTALPESVVTLVAVAFSASPQSKELGVGAALGGPLALATVAYGTVGATLLLTGRHLAVCAGGGGHGRRLARDQAWFLAIFAAKIALGLVAFQAKPWLGIAFLAAYALYVRGEMAGGPAADEEEEDGGLEPLRLSPRAARPGMAAALVQTGAALLVIFLASRLFVSRLEALGPALGLPPQLLALLLSPIATELPETMNAVIWVRQGKHRLALANISGAMMIQATIPTALGLFFTPWRLSPPLLLAAAATAAAVLVLCVAFHLGRVGRTTLAAMGGGYLLFVGALMALPAG